MTGENSEQRSLTDFTGQTSDTRSLKPEPESPPSGENPADLLAWLRKDSTPSPEVAVNRLPKLVEQVNTGGYNAWSAGNCINLILAASPPPVDCPELVSVLDSEHVEQSALIEHLLRIYPRKAPVLPDSFELESLETLSHADRMEAYRLLSRLPPDEEIYSKLKQVAEMFDGVADLAGTKYPVGGFFHTYAMRCLTIYLQDPDRAPAELARQAITDKIWSALRVIAGDPEQAVEAGLTDYLITKLDDTNTPQEFCDGHIIQSLCETYLHTTDPTVHHETGKVIQSALKAGVYPVHWDRFVSELVDGIKSGEFDNQAGAVLAGILTSIQDRDFDVNIESFFSVDAVIEGFSADPDPWISSIIVLVDYWPDLLYEHVEQLVAVARRQDGRDRTTICDAIASLGETRPADVLPAIEPLVRDLERASSAREVNDVGTILLALDIYPPPPQLKDLYGSTDKNIDATAKEIVDKLRRQFNDSVPALEPGKVDTIQTLSKEYSLVRRTGAVTWESPSLSSSEFSLISTIATIAVTALREESTQNERVLAVLHDLLGEQIEIEENDPSIQFVVPSHDPAWVEFAVLGTIFAQIVNPDLRVALHTPAINGWGTKKDIREALEQYGIAPSNNPEAEVIPLFDLVPTARITDGEIIVERSMTTISDDPPFLTLVRDIELLGESPADIILYNYLSGIDAVDATQIQQWRGSLAESLPANDDPFDDERALVADGFGEIADQASLINLVQIDDVDPESVKQHHPDNPVHVEIHGIFSAHRAADRRQHIGPPTDLPAPYLITDKSDSSQDSLNESSNGRARAATRLVSGSSRVELHAIQSDANIGGLLAKIDDYIDRIGDADSASALRSFRFTLGSLPVPVDLHDTWIQTQVDQGNRWVPRRLYDRRNGIRTLADEAVLDAQVLDDALITIDTLLDRLGESNPLFEKLLEILDDAAVEGKRVGILCAKKTYKDMLSTSQSNLATPSWS